MASKRFAGVIAAGVMCIHGLASAQTARQERAVSGFDQIAWRAVGELRITQGSKEGLVIEAEPRLLRGVIAEVKAGVLDIRFAEGQFATQHPIRFHVWVKALKRLDAQSSGDIVIERLETPSLNIELNGSGDLRIGELVTPRLVTKLTGSSNIEVAGGHAAHQTIDLSGSGTYQAPSLTTEESAISIAGSGDVTVMATRKLFARISGSGDIRYLGNPHIVESVSGAGTIKKIGTN